MLRKFYAQRKVPLSFSKAFLSSYKNSFSNLASSSAPSRRSDVISKHRCRCRFSVMASTDVPITVPDGDGNIVPAPLRSYQVVVAATRDMGIGKDGKLPWRLPSDLKFFKELTTATSDPGKKNAVVMGRKTWESVPLLYKPLPGRLNVVLTRSGSFDIATAENVVVCGSVTSALELLAEPPYSVSIEKVFIIGGGQIYRETLNGVGCDAIHITKIEANIECDTFIPTIDISAFQPRYSSPPMVENNIRYSFSTYVRVRNFAIGPDP